MNNKEHTKAGQEKIINRAIHFIANNTKDESYRMGQAIIAELELVKNFSIPEVSIEELEPVVRHAIFDAENPAEILQEDNEYDKRFIKALRNAGYDIVKQ